MIPLYMTDTAARLVFPAIFVLWLLSEVLILARQAGRRVGWRQDRLSGIVLVVFLVLGLRLGLLFATAFPSYAVKDSRPFVFALGALLALAGIAFRWYAIITLGRFFTTRVMTVSDQTVVDKGPYRWIRHPSYTGALMTVLGILLCATNWLSLACFLLTLPGFAYRIRVEEQALSARLGQAYSDYMRRTKRLMPFVV